MSICVCVCMFVMYTHTFTYIEKICREKERESQSEDRRERNRKIYDCSQNCERATLLCYRVARITRRRPRLFVLFHIFSPVMCRRGFRSFTFAQRRRRPRRRRRRRPWRGEQIVHRRVRLFMAVNRTSRQWRDVLYKRAKVFHHTHRMESVRVVVARVEGGRKTQGYNIE